MVPLIKQFVHVFIHHKFDLALSTTLPNKFAQRPNPKYSEEIRRSVQRDDQGSLSPCTVPILLMPKKNEDDTFVWIVELSTKSLSHIFFPISCLSDLFDELYGVKYSQIFILEAIIIKYVFMNVMSGRLHSNLKKGFMNSLPCHLVFLIHLLHL